MKNKLTLSVFVCLFVFSNLSFGKNINNNRILIAVASEPFSSSLQQNLAIAAEGFFVEANPLSCIPQNSVLLNQPDTTITAAEAVKHIGETKTVCDSVFGSRFLESSNTQPTFLNLGAAYPASPFTVLIMGKDRINFKEKPEIIYNNKKICVTGLIIDYKGKAEMVISNESMITMAE